MRRVSSLGNGVVWFAAELGCGFGGWAVCFSIVNITNSPRSGCDTKELTTVKRQLIIIRAQCSPLEDS